MKFDRVPDQILQDLRPAARDSTGSTTRLAIAQVEVLMQFETWISAPVAYSNGVRRHPRTLFSVPITLDFGSGHEVRSTHGISLDISEGGLGVLLQAKLEVGETVAVHLPLPKHYLTTVAVVRHSSKLLSGLEFVGLTPDQWSQIAIASTPQLPVVW
jgi:hypothetical protein